MKKQITDARQAPFVWFDPALDDAELSPYEFRLYCRIARITSGGKPHYFEALTKSAQICKMSERAARYAIKGLLKRQMLQCILKIAGEPSVYALTDKTIWIFAPPARTAPLHYVQTSPALPAAPPAPRAAVPLHHVPTNKIKQKEKKKEKIEKMAATAAVPAAVAAARARTTGMTAASRFPETLILDYLEASKPHNHARNSGLAHKLWLTGEDDHLIERWQHRQHPKAAPPTPPEISSPHYTEFWQGILPQLRDAVNSLSFQTWFAPLNARQHEDRIIITAPDQVFSEWLEANYADVLNNAGLTHREWEFSTSAQ